MSTPVNIPFKELKRLYKNALDAEQESFFYRGQEILVSYAKYLIEYYDGLYKQDKK